MCRSWSTTVTDGQTDDMQSQYCALHYSASCSKKTSCQVNCWNAHGSSTGTGHNERWRLSPGPWGSLAEESTNDLSLPSRHHLLSLETTLMFWSHYLPRLWNSQYWYTAPELYCRIGLARNCLMTLKTNPAFEHIWRPTLPYIYSTSCFIQL